MPGLREALTSGRAILMDGAMGTELQKQGLRTGECAERWNVVYRERVAAVHRAYASAGSEILLTNTFQASPASLRRKGCSVPAVDVIRAGVELAAGFSTWVAGDIGPFDSEDDIQDMAAALRPCDAIIVETISDIEPLARLANEMTATPRPLVMASATYLREGEGLTTFRRVKPESFARQAAAYADVVGVNCGRDLGEADILEIVRRHRDATTLPLMIRPNAGTPIERDGRWIYPISADRMADWLPEILAEGVNLIGGCCGTTPDHIAAFRIVLELWNAANNR